jgi:hypothetical protein
MLRLAGTLRPVAAAPWPAAWNAAEAARVWPLRRAPCESHRSVLPDGRVRRRRLRKGPRLIQPDLSRHGGAFDPIRGTFSLHVEPGGSSCRAHRDRFPMDASCSSGLTSGGRTAAARFPIRRQRRSGAARIRASPRVGHTATAPADGRVLVAGGETESGPLQTPRSSTRTGRFSPAAKLREPDRPLGHAVTDGWVLSRADADRERAAPSFLSMVDSARDARARPGARGRAPLGMPRRALRTAAS